MYPDLNLKHLASLVIKEIKNLKGNEKLDITDLRNGDQIAMAVAKSSKRGSDGFDMNDQRWHGGGGGGTTVSLQTNDVVNATQTVLNLIEGTNMTITDDGVGGITFDATGGGAGNPASPDTSIQFNDGGNFGGSQILYTEDLSDPTYPIVNLTSVASTDVSGYGGELNIHAGNAVGDGEGMRIDIQGGQGGATNQGGQVYLGGGRGGTTSGDGGDVVIFGGYPHNNVQIGKGGEVQIVGGGSTDNTAGGRVYISGGTGSADGIATGDGGNIEILGGIPGATGSGGSLSLTAGDGGATSGDGGEIDITSGNAATGDSGSIFITAGGITNSGNAGAVEITGGYGGPSGSAGMVTIDGGFGNTVNPGADVYVRAGSGASTTAGGTTNIVGGNGGSDGNGGLVNITAGNANGTGLFAGTVNITSGGGNTSGTIGPDVTVTLGKSFDTFSPDGTFRIKGARGNAYSQRITGSITTTNATPTSIPVSLVHAVNPSTLYIEARVVGRRTGGSSGSSGDSGVYVRKACYKVTGGAVLLGSVQDDFTQESQAGWDCTFAISGTYVVLQVTGATNNNISWYFELMYIINDA